MAKNAASDPLQDPSASILPRLLNYAASALGLRIITLLLYIAAVYCACLSVILSKPLGSFLSGDRQGQTASLRVLMNNDLSGALSLAASYIYTFQCMSLFCRHAVLLGRFCTTAHVLQEPSQTSAVHVSRKMDLRQKIQICFALRCKCPFNKLGYC